MLGNAIHCQTDTYASLVVQLSASRNLFLLSLIVGHMQLNLFTDHAALAFVDVRIEADFLHNGEGTHGVPLATWRGARARVVWPAAAGGTPSGLCPTRTGRSRAAARAA